METKSWLLLSFFTILKFQINGHQGKHESIFLRDGVTNYCDEKLKCSDYTNHSLCFYAYNTKKIKCTDYREYDLQGLENDIVLAHNGIRNRIAQRMKIPDMIRLKWDDELSNMAHGWIRSKCQPWKLDPCTNFNRYKTNRFESVYDLTPQFHYVNQNFYFLRYDFLPQNFIFAAMRAWYLEKNHQREPALIRIQNRKKDIMRHIDFSNNFTQLAFPPTQRVGCALTKLEGGYAFTCNYFMYIPYANVEYNEPAMNCPNRFPLSDLQFENLCTECKFKFLNENN